MRDRIISTERDHYGDEDEIDSVDAIGYEEVDDSGADRPVRVPPLFPVPQNHRLRDSAEDAPCIIVEDGEGFRPLSPGRHGRQSRRRSI